jgi:hypothetical protein
MRADSVRRCAARLIAAVNATLEELLWRGVYIRLFPGRLIAGFLYPTVYLTERIEA